MPSRGELRSRPVLVSNPGTRHRRDPSPPRSCSIASFRLWPHAIIPHKRNEQASGVKRQDSAHTRQQPQPCVTEHRFLLPLTRTPKTPHYRISSHQIAPSSLDSGLPSTSPSLVERTGSDHEEERLCRRDPLPRGLTCITGPRGGNQKGFRERPPLRFFRGGGGALLAQYLRTS